MKITRVGIDLGKSVFQLHAVDRSGHVVVEKRMTRRALARFMGEIEPCLVGLEACGARTTGRGCFAAWGTMRG